MFWDDSIENPGDREQREAILQVMAPGGPVGAQGRFKRGLKVFPDRRDFVERRKSFYDVFHQMY